MHIIMMRLLTVRTSMCLEKTSRETVVSPMRESGMLLRDRDAFFEEGSLLDVSVIN